MPISEGPIEATAIGVQTQPPQRRQKMAEIRQMLDEVQGGDGRRAAEPNYATERWGSRSIGHAPAQPRADVREAVFGHARGGDFEDEDESFLRSRMGVAGQSGRLKTVRAGEEYPEGSAARKRLMHKHRRRHRKFEDAKRRGSGAGRTGFVFVLLVAGVLTGLYAFEERIAERLPETAPALRNYATVVDGVRADLETRLGGLRGMIEESLARDEG